MNRGERRRQKREKQKLSRQVGVMVGGPSPAVLPIVHQFVGDHAGHTLQIEDDLQAVLTLRCVDCEVGDENE
jgi:hypothetical protein